MAGPELWTQDSPGIVDSSEDLDGFGWALAIGDFNADGYGDLAVGVPGEILESLNHSSGAVHVLHGSQVGLTANDSQFWHQEVPGVPGEGGGIFGVARLAAGLAGRVHQRLRVRRHLGVVGDGAVGGARSI